MDKLKEVQKFNQIMRYCLFTLGTICFSFLANGQSGTLIDARDGKSYLTTEINGVQWMLKNLEFETPRSVAVTPEQAERFKQFKLQGRYYHFEELDSVCPTGWRIPNVQDWTTYFQFLAEAYPEIKLDVLTFDEDNHYTTFMNYNQRIDLFKENNPMNLNPTGRIEGTTFNVPDVYADLWTLDDEETFMGKSHIHIMNPWTTIHSHKHNLKPKQEKKLRKFMVRCVSTMTPE